MKKKLIIIGKFAISFAILAFLFKNAFQNDQFKDVAQQEKNWLWLGLGIVTAFSAVVLSIVRWYLLVRALNIPLRLIDALRLGFIGFLFTFLTLGVVGGDAVKAIFLAKQNPKEKTAAVTSVFVDRLIGLFALFCITSLAYLFFLKAPEDPDVRWSSITLACKISVGMTALGFVFFFSLFWSPKILFSKFMWRVFAIPKIGGAIRSVCMSIVSYRKRFDVILTSLAMSLGVHSLLTLSVFFVAGGLYSNFPSLTSHFVIVPIANVANALPLPGGLGAFEAALQFLYSSFSKFGSPALSEKPISGLIVAFGFRLITLLIAAIGVIFYLARKKDLDELIDEAQHEADHKND